MQGARYPLGIAAVGSTLIYGTRPAEGIQLVQNILGNDSWPGCWKKAEPYVLISRNAGKK